MGRIKILNEGSGRKKVSVRFRDSDHFDSSHYIHKYYLSSEEREKLFPVDIIALQMCIESDDQISLWEGVIPAVLPDCTILYRDIGLVKHVDGDLVRCALLAILNYQNDLHAELTPEEVRAALNLNEWLREYEKTLLAKQLSIEEELRNCLRGNDPFMVDYEIELKIDFYLREDDSFCNNEDAHKHDWDSDSALMCCHKFISSREMKNPDYYDDFNDMCFRAHRNPVYQAQHCELFHELTEHCDVPHKHLIRIGIISAEFEVLYQNMVDIDLAGERIIAKQQDTWQGKLIDHG